MKTNRRITFANVMLLCIICLFVFAQNTQAQMVRDSLSQGQQKSAFHVRKTPIKQAMLTELNRTGSDLKWAQYFMLVSSGLSLLNPFIGYKKETTIESNGYYAEVKEERKPTALGYTLSLGAFASSVMADYRIGKAGSRLRSIGDGISDEYGFKLVQAGGYLQSYRTLRYIGNGLNILGSIIMANAASNLDDENIDEGTSQFFTGAGLLLSSVIFNYIAVGKIGKAGEYFQDYSKQMISAREKFYLNECGTNLKKYEDRWKTGFGLIVSGFGIVLISGLLIENEGAAIGTMVVGGVMVFSGYLMMSWLAPTSLGSAGDNVQSYQGYLQGR